MPDAEEDRSFYGEANEAMAYVEGIGLFPGSASILGAMALAEQATNAMGDDGWDLPPELVFFTMEPLSDPQSTTPDDDGLVTVPMATKVGSVPLPTGSGPEIYQLLSEAGEDFVRWVDTAVGGVTIGFGLSHEGWKVLAQPGDDEPLEMARQHRLSEHPERVECRVMTAVDRYQNLLHIMRDRGGEQEAVVRIGRPEPELDEGLLVEGLRQLADRIET